MRYFLPLLFISFLIPGSAMAQVNVNLAWDPSDTQGTVENPINYRLYICSDQALTICTVHETNSLLTFGPVILAHNSTTYFYATAWNRVLEVDGTLSGTIQESGKSNTLRVRAFAPPGNPKNNRISVTQLGNSKSFLPTLIASLVKN